VERAKKSFFLFFYNREPKASGFFRFTKVFPFRSFHAREKLPQTRFLFSYQSKRKPKVDAEKAATSGALMNYRGMI
jgi:hypothetical protein